MTARKPSLLEIARDADLNASGLDKPRYKKKLGLVDNVLERKEVERLTGIENCAAYEIPYFDVGGKRTNYSRYKLISLSDKELKIKYWQEEKTIPKLYFPPIVKWSEIARDTSRRIVITEGEKKAACATTFDLPAISVGGVWAWKSKKWSLDSIPDFQDVNWHGRDVEICYDGDLYDNEGVYRALKSLVAYLTKLGGRVFVRYLPMTEGISKMDDFLVQRGLREYEKLMCSQADLSKELVELNEKVVYVEDVNWFLDVGLGVFLKTERDLDRKFGTSKIVSDNGKEIPATKFWAEWPHRATVRTVTYAPGEPKFADGCYNTWKGWGTTPKKSSVSPFLELISSIEHKDWFLRWLAYPLQYPGTKLFTAVVLWSVENGTGKTFIGELMRKIYGSENSGQITSSDLHDGRYDWLANKQFILGDEVSDFVHKYQDRNALKSIITGETVRVNRKYQPQIELPNCANMLFTSNHPDAVKIDPEDRRFFVAELSQTRDQNFWDEFDEWAWKKGGAEALHWYLLNRVDCSEFNPKGRPPVTNSKTEMIQHGMSSLEQWCGELLTDLESAVSAGASREVIAAIPKGQDVFTVSQIMYWLPDHLSTVTPTALGKALRRMGAVGLSQPVRTKGQKGKLVRLVAVRNVGYWRRTGDERVWIANYEGKTTVADRDRKLGRSE